MNDEPTDGAKAAQANDDNTGGRTRLSESERAVALATGMAPTDRAAALRAGTVPVPRKFVRWIIVAFAVLGLGGIVAEKLIGNAGVGSLISTPVTTLAGTGPAGSSGSAGASGSRGSRGLGATSGTAPSTPAPPDAPAIGASPSAVIGLTHLAGRPAPAFSLQNQKGMSWTLADARGKVVVLTFFNAECDDICPVLSREIIEADQLLGPRSADVDFVVVNSDPLETSLAPTPPALARTGLAGISTVTFLNGTLADLSAVWAHYGVTVALDNTTRVITHTDVMDFIDPDGRLEMSATPFANESTLGLYSLQPAVIHSFAQGVADSAAGLLGRGAP